MRWSWDPKDQMVPFVGVCWFEGEVIVSLWPLVLRLGRARKLVGWRRVADGYERPIAR